MPISIVVGGQFGSEGKGKVACLLAKQRAARAVVRVGGPNSGHTVMDNAGKAWIFRQLPTAAVLADPICVLSTGSYIDLDVLRSEVSMIGLNKSRLKIDPHAVVITPECKMRELDGDLRARIGSTLTGTGGAVCMRTERSPALRFAKDEPDLAEYICDASDYLDRCCATGDRVVAEGSQGFGLSVTHTPFYPFATSRDTTAAGILSEIGLSPLLVDEIALVIRAFPIRVPGNSGPLANETTWEAIAREGDFPDTFCELTSVTRAKRRVAHFDADLVRASVRVNRPTSIYLNHLDYADRVASATKSVTGRARTLVESISRSIGGCINYVGLGPEDCQPFESSNCLFLAA